MGKSIVLEASDGFRLGGYIAEPDGKPRGALVVCQEVFGVNPHVRGVCDRYAREGYVAIAPALFDRVQRDVELGYTQDDIGKGVALMKQASMDDAMKDVRAAIAATRHAGKAGAVGYCWGGTVTWAAAARVTELACAISYYGGGVAGMLDEKPRCPIVMHFGDNDASIPMANVEKFRAAHPSVPVHVYPAGHGFNCEARASYDAASAALALERSLAFLRQHVG